MIQRKTILDEIKDTINSQKIGSELSSQYIYQILKKKNYTRFIGTTDNYLIMLKMNGYLERTVIGRKGIPTKFKILRHIEDNITVQTLTKMNKERIKNERNN